jgi:large subunit ribosomal protein L1
MAKKRGKAYRETMERFDRRTHYPLEDAVRILHESPRRKIEESVELSMRLGVDPRHADQQVRGTIVLPNGIGKELKIIVFAKGEAAAAAEAAGADVVGADDLVEKVNGGWTDFDVAIAAPDMMGSVGRLGRILGPRGLMPNPRTGTVTPDVGKAVGEAKAGRVEYRTDRAGNVSAAVGKITFEQDKIVENARALIDTVVRARPAAAKGQYVRSATLSTTMGPGVRLDRASLSN